MRDTDTPRGEPDRRTFLKHAGLIGLCGCGLPAEAVASTGPNAEDRGTPPESDPQAQPAPTEPLAKQWVAALLPLLAAGDREHARTFIRRCSEPHFQALAMQETLDKFRGNLAGFLRHLEKEWGWVVKYSPEQGVILIDENKPTCVCPVLPKQRTGDLGLLCYCSEGFAERMFSRVVGAPVRAEVTTSVLRGDRTCTYRIDLKA